MIVADNAGFCFGVKRAIKMANDTMDQAGARVKSLGQLIHNPQVVNSFQKRGLKAFIQIVFSILRNNFAVVPQVYCGLLARHISILSSTRKSTHSGA